MIATDWGEVVGGGFSALLGLAFAAAAIYIAVRQLRLPSRATGTVIAADSYENEPVVRFTARDGRTIDFRATAGGHVGRWGYRIGQSVAVRYDPQHPHLATIATFRGSWLTPLVGLLLGAAFIWVGVSVIADQTNEPVQRVDPMVRAARERVYLPLVATLAKLRACIDDECAKRAERDAIDLFEAARRRTLASGAHSVAVNADLAALHNTIVSSGSRAQRLLDEQVTPQLERTYKRIVEELCRPRPPTSKFCDLVFDDA